MQKQKGFTLIEVMIVVSIIGILASIALPSYQNSVSKARRTDAMSALQGLAQAMERHYMTAGAYTAAAAGAADTGAPTIFSTKSPIDGSQTFYNLTISVATPTTYTLTADPANGQEGDGNITLSQTGARGWDKDDDGAYAATENCWETSC
ncbi:MAG: type IV pilin protein [Pseudomonadales bacterium]|nr:type IV pilin protein [Pseudomonadales bacterium]